ncbi:ATP-binding protein [Sphingosinicella humi]|nr:ATP-binding protein [Sphingosinicella humi]
MNDQTRDMRGTVTDRPSAFPLRIQGGMLEALGINMYSTIGKCLVEFVANAYDGEAKRVEITIPVEGIAKARQEARAQAKREVEENLRDPFTVLLTPLPDDVAIIIEDNGHGMSPHDVETKFLPINRKRRLDDEGNETRLTSESGARKVMGRKGLGKLAGFGAANKVVIRTKRSGETYATTFTLDDSIIRSAEDMADVEIPASYEDGLSTDEQGTRITLSSLKSDAVRFSTRVIADAIREAFYGIEAAELAISINDEAIEPEKIDYEFVYPEGATVDDLAEAEIEVEGLTKLPVRYMVGFLPRGQNLPVSKRGARIYCNGRLAAGPTMFGLPTGMHNFHSQSYMQSIVRADALDQHGIDLVNTNRTQLREDNEIVGSLIAFVEEAMRKSLAAHAKWREAAVDDEIEKSDTAKRMLRLTNSLEGKAKTSAKKLLRALAVEHGPDSKEFNELAPLVVESVNAGEVLLRLSEMGHDPKSIQQIAINLAELAEIEKSDALKIYRGRRNGINALLKLIREGEGELWKKKGIENRLHNLLKRDPWLIKAEYSRYLTSDERLSNVSTAIAEHLAVDKAAKLDDPTRPDLVFVLSDTDMPHLITIVELKSPSLPLNHDHLTQLKKYMAKVATYCQNELHRSVTVHGYLIGAMPDEKTTNDDERLLLSEMQKSGPSSDWLVIGVRALLERAQVSHASVIQALEDDIKNERADDAFDGDSAEQPSELLEAGA